MEIKNKIITCFIDSLSSGGAELQMSYLCDFLYDKGYDITLVTFGDVKDLHHVNENIKRVRLCQGGSRKSKVFSIFKYFATCKTDVVISFGQRENLLCIIPLCIRRKIKVIAGERNFTVGTPDRIEKLLNNYFYHRATFVVPNSYSQGKHLYTYKSYLKKKVKTITNYTDLALYNPKELPGGSTKMVGIFCRYDLQKNYERFAYAVKLLKSKVTEPFMFVWYGDKTFLGRENHMYVEFKSLVEKLGIGDVLKLEDHVLDVKSELDKYDIICLPSLHEGFSNSIAEAICCGKPMMVSNVSDNSVMVHNNENGVLFNPLDVDDMASSMATLIKKSPAELKEMAKASRTIAESLFNKEKFINSYIEIIES